MLLIFFAGKYVYCKYIGDLITDKMKDFNVFRTNEVKVNLFFIAYILNFNNQSLEKQNTDNVYCIFTHVMFSHLLFFVFFVN